MDRIICHANGTCTMIFSNPLWDILPIIIIAFAIITIIALAYKYFPRKKKKK